MANFTNNKIWIIINKIKILVILWCNHQVIWILITKCLKIQWITFSLKIKNIFDLTFLINYNILDTYKYKTYSLLEIHFINFPLKKYTFNILKIKITY